MIVCQHVVPKGARWGEGVTTSKSLHKSKMGKASGSIVITKLLRNEERMHHL